MLDICLLGTGGLMPLPERHLTSLIARAQGVSLLIDCGEGTQVALRRFGFSPYDIGLILVTHVHGDHVAGLSGILLAIAQSNRRDPVLIAGPPPLLKVVQGLCVIVPSLPFEARVWELPAHIEPNAEGPVIECGPMVVHPFSLKHHIPCLGYSIELPRMPAFDPEAARRLGVPVDQWKVLQYGNTVEVDGRLILPEEVTGPPRRGLKVTYCTDTLPIPAIAHAARGADLMVCEGMYGDMAEQPALVEKRHMMMQEAAMLAKEAGAERLWLTHYSPANDQPQQYEEELKRIFPGTVVSRDGERTQLHFQ